MKAPATIPYGKCGRCKKHFKTTLWRYKKEYLCEDCFNTGFKGRALIAEIVELDNQLRKAILAKSDLEGLEAILKSKGYANMLADGKGLVDKGVTTQDELNKVCGIWQEN